MLKLIVDFAHYVDWSGNQQASLTEPIQKRGGTHDCQYYDRRCYFWLRRLGLSEIYK
jgi:hypothetical protein